MELLYANTSALKARALYKYKVRECSTSLIQPKPHHKLSHIELLLKSALTSFDKTNTLWTPVAGYGTTILLYDSDFSASFTTLHEFACAGRS